MEWLHPGRTCWKTAHAARASLLVDGQSYFGALRRAAIAAERSIFIVGWDVDTRTRLRKPSPDADVHPELLLEFLNALLALKPNLHVHVLAWDFSVIYALERELMPSYRFSRDAHPRLHYMLDSQHPVGASHHQKIVVVDDQVAFVGGYDLTIRRWDTAEHRVVDPERVDPSGEAYEPIHDVQLALQGQAAATVGELARLRWRSATQQDLTIPDAPARAFLDFDAAAVFEDVTVGVARTQPSIVPGGEDIREVLHLTLLGIRRAQRLIYIENQYFTSASVADALIERLDAAQGPEVVLILPKTQSGWLERSSMGVLRARALARLRASDRHGRLHVYSPVVSGVPVQVHSKLILVDDQLLKVGSANLSNRSMGLDTECDIALAVNHQIGVAADAADQRVRTGVLATLAHLLSEHLALPAHQVLQAHERGGLVALIEGRRGSSRCLEPIEESHDGVGLAGFEDQIADPERPLSADVFMSGLLPVDMNHPVRRSLFAMLAMLGATLIVGGLLSWTSLSEVSSAERLSALLVALRDSQLSLLYLGLLFVGATLLLCPITLLIGATVLVFDPWQGFVHALTGSLMAASASYGLGRVFGPTLLRTFATPRLNALRRQLQAHGLRATVIARVLPVGNFTMINLVAGAVPVAFPAFLLGNVLGLMPGVLSLTLLAARIEQALRFPTLSNVSALGLCVVGLLLLLYGISKLFSKWNTRRAARHAASESAL